MGQLGHIGWWYILHQPGRWVRRLCHMSSLSFYVRVLTLQWSNATAQCKRCPLSRQTLPRGQFATLLGFSRQRRIMRPSMHAYRPGPRRLDASRLPKLRIASRPLGSRGLTACGWLTCRAEEGRRAGRRFYRVCVWPRALASPCKTSNRRGNRLQIRGGPLSRSTRQYSDTPLVSGTSTSGTAPP